MKILKFYILLFISGLLSVSSCVKEENPLSPKDDLINHIGYWHNVAVEAFFASNNFKSGSPTEVYSYLEIRDIIMKELAKKDNQLFDYDFIKADLAWSDEVLKKNGIINESLSGNVRKNEIHPINYSVVFKYLFEINEIGETLYLAFSDLNKKVMENDVSRQEIIKLSKQIKDLPLSEKEKSYVDVFNQVLQHSNAYWENTHSKMLDKKTVAIIWADAAGGLYGMLCGPICSIIEGALFSTIVAIQE